MIINIFFISVSSTDSTFHSAFIEGGSPTSRFFFGLSQGVVDFYTMQQKSSVGGSSCAYTWVSSQVLTPRQKEQALRNLESSWAWGWSRLENVICKNWSFDKQWVDPLSSFLPFKCPNMESLALREMLQALQCRLHFHNHLELISCLVLTNNSSSLVVIHPVFLNFYWFWWLYFGNLQFFLLDFL